MDYRRDSPRQYQGDRSRDGRNYHDGRRGGYQGGRGYGSRGGPGYGYRRNDGPPERGRDLQDIQNLIVRIGDNPSSPVDRNLEGLVEVLGALPLSMKSSILDIIFKCVLALPTKTPIYGTLVGLLNISQPAFGEDVLKRVHSELETALTKNEAYNLKFLIRFLGELVNSKVVNSDCLFPIFHKLLSDENTALQGRRDFFTLAVMQALPYVGAILNNSDPNRLSDIFDLLNIKTANRDPDANLCVSIYTNEKPIPRLRWLYEALSDHAKLGWPTPLAIRTPQISLAGKLNSTKTHIWAEIIGEASTIDESGLHLPEENRDSPTDYPIPQNLFRIFGNEPYPLWEGRNMSDLNRAIIEDLIIDIIHFFRDSYTECARQILSIPIGIPIASIYDIIIETLFLELFNLPQSEFSRIYYGLLFAEFSKKNPEQFPGALSKAILLLYDRIGDLDVECYFIFTEWFAHHLSNFDYKWVWGQWVNPTDGAHKDFIREVLLRCIRLAYHERIEKAIPPEMIPLLPSKSKPNFKFLDPHVPGVEAARYIYAKIKERIPPNELQEWMSSSAGEAFLQLEQDVQVDVFVSCLISVGSKAYSYLVNVIERYLSLFKHLVGTTSGEQQTVESVVQFWKYSPQHIIITLSKFVSYQIIKPTDVIKPTSLHFYKQHWIWEVLHGAVQSAINRTQIIQKMIDQANESETKSFEDQPLESLLEQLEEANIEIRDVFLILFQSFEMTLTQNLQALDSSNGAPTEDTPYLDAYWMKITTGQFKSFSRKYYLLLKELVDTFDILFGKNTDARILQIYEQAKAIILNY